MVVMPPDTVVVPVMMIMTRMVMLVSVGGVIVCHTPHLEPPLRYVKPSNTLSI